MHKLTAQLVGMKKFEGVVGEGNDRERIKSLSVFALLPMEPVDKKDAEQEIGRKGSMVVAYKSDDFRIWDELKNHPFPCTADLEFETFATGAGKTKEVLVSVKARGSVAKVA